MSTTKSQRKSNRNRACFFRTLFAVPLLVGLLVLGTAGCKSSKQPAAAFRGVPVQAGGNSALREALSAPAKGAPEDRSEKLLLREGDTIRISFPGAPNLNNAQQIRRDGKVTLPLIGEFKAAGLAPMEMEKKLLELYEPQLQTKEISVTLESSAFVVYVTGAVLRPGKVLSDRPITALQAIMRPEALTMPKRT
jgi:protein involved in polysaccharide export with SLBB domain